MITVSLVGIDGVGKTTVARKVASEFPHPIQYLYMGSNINASNHALPTTRWWKSRQRGRGLAPARARPKSVVHKLRKSIGVLNRVAEEMYRASIVARYRQRGHIVLLDRHFVLDYYHEDHGPNSGRRTLKRRLEGFMRQRLHRMPDLVICLDLCGRAAYARKGEFSPELLDARRRQYLELGRVVSSFAIVDASQDLDTVVEEVRQLILAAYGRKRNGNQIH